MKNNIKYGCCAVVFRTYPVQQALEWIAEGGFKNVELEANYDWCNHVDLRKDDPIKFKEMADGYGLKITALDCHRELIDAGKLTYDPVADLTLALEWAKAAGVPVVVTDEGKMPSLDYSEELALASIKAKLEKVVPVAEKNQVYLCFEPHGQLSLIPGGLRNILSLVPSKWTGVNLDTANPSRGNYVHIDEEGNSVWMLPQDFPKCDEIQVMEPVVDRIRNLHFKDVVGRQACALGDGQVKLDLVVDRLYKAAFDGVLSWQTEGWEDADTTKVWMKQSKALMERLIEEVTARP